MVEGFEPVHIPPYMGVCLVHAHPTAKNRLEKLARVISLLLGLFLFFIIQLLQPPLSIFIYLLVFSEFLLHL
jgi:hypothetical protein